jgi:hypothetical protein
MPQLESADDNPSFVTTMPAAHDHACVTIMEWDVTNQEYRIRKCSRALPQNAAAHLAQSWAAAMRLEIR